MCHTQRHRQIDIHTFIFFIYAPSFTDVHFCLHYYYGNFICVTNRHVYMWYLNANRCFQKGKPIFGQLAYPNIQTNNGRPWWLPRYWENNRDSWSNTLTLLLILCAQVNIKMWNILIQRKVSRCVDIISEDIHQYYKHAEKYWKKNMYNMHLSVPIHKHQHQYSDTCNIHTLGQFEHSTAG